MRFYPPSITSVARSLAGRLDHLRHTLDALGQRLREAEAGAVGQAVAGAVREAVHAVLANPMHGQATPCRPAWSLALSTPLWDEPDGLERAGNPPEFWPDDVEEDNRELPGSEGLPSPAVPKASHWHQPLAVGFETAARWLRQPAARHPILTALSAGLASTVAAFAAGAGLVRSALSLLALADTVRSGAAALAWIGTS